LAVDETYVGGVTLTDFVLNICDPDAMISTIIGGGP
jgi:hypothetical protein